jgi:hypothetical protein
MNRINSIWPVTTAEQAHEERVYDAAKSLLDGELLYRDSECHICGKPISDSLSVARGIGSDCWQHVLEQLDLMAVSA